MLLEVNKKLLEVKYNLYIIILILPRLLLDKMCCAQGDWFTTK